MLASPALAGARAFAATVSGSLGIPIPAISAPSPSQARRRASLVVVAKVKVSTPQADRIARHVRLRKKVVIAPARGELANVVSNLLQCDDCALLFAVSW